MNEEYIREYEEEANPFADFETALQLTLYEKDLAQFKRVLKWLSCKEDAAAILCKWQVSYRDIVTSFFDQTRQIALKYPEHLEDIMQTAEMGLKRINRRFPEEDPEPEKKSAPLIRHGRVIE